MKRNSNSYGTGGRVRFASLAASALVLSLIIFCFTDVETAIAQETASLTGLTVNPVAGDPTSLTLSWDAVTGSDVFYYVYWNKQQGWDGENYYDGSDSTSDTNFVVYSLTADTTYVIRVEALDFDTNTRTIGTINGTTLDPIDSLNVTEVTGDHTRLNATWTEVNGATGYVVQ